MILIEIKTFGKIDKPILKTADSYTVYNCKEHYDIEVYMSQYVQVSTINFILLKYHIQRSGNNKNEERRLKAMHYSRQKCKDLS